MREAEETELKRAWRDKQRNRVITMRLSTPANDERRLEIYTIRKRLDGRVVGASIYFNMLA